MELTESIKSINKQLIDLYGIDTSTGRAIWRVVFSEDQYEKRLMEVTDGGLMLLRPEIREVPKYRQWIHEKYVLERLVLVPNMNQPELGGLKQSYEPLFVFADKNDGYLPPRLDVCQITIDSVYAAQGKSSLAKYKEVTGQDAVEAKKKEIDSMVEYIYGDETDVTDALTRKEGIVVPNNYEKKES